MANVPLVTNPIIPPIPDEPKLHDDEDPELQKIFDSLWKWMKDLSIQLKILLGSPQASNSQITIPLVQSGTILAFGGVPANIPTGYFACDGSQVSKTDFSGLFSAIGTTWNTGGEAAGNFRLPDFRGRDLLGAGPGAGLTPRTVGQTGGEETHTLAAAEIPSGLTVTITDLGHTHPITDLQHSHQIASMGLNGVKSCVTLQDPNAHGVAATGGAGADPYVNRTGDGQNNHPLVASSPSNVSVQSAPASLSAVAAGGGGAHNNMQPYGVIQYMIKY